MKCFVFSIGEPTTGLCVELMKKFGQEVYLDQAPDSLWHKLKRFYEVALESEDEYFMRIDADILPNWNVNKLIEPTTGWTCATGYDWYKQDNGPISVHVMSRNVIQKVYEHIMKAEHEIRPETYLWRLPDVNPQTKIEERFGCGIHGYGQQDHRQRIKKLKHSRNQQYDWELVERIERL